MNAPATCAEGIVPRRRPPGERGSVSRPGAPIVWCSVRPFGHRRPRFTGWSGSPCRRRPCRRAPRPACRSRRSSSRTSCAPSGRAAGCAHRAEALVGLVAVALLAVAEASTREQRVERPHRCPFEVRANDPGMSSGDHRHVEEVLGPPARPRRRGGALRAPIRRLRRHPPAHPRGHGEDERDAQPARVSRTEPHHSIRGLWASRIRLAPVAASCTPMPTSAHRRCPVRNSQGDRRREEAHDRQAVCARPGGRARRRGGRWRTRRPHPPPP